MPRDSTYVPSDATDSVKGELDSWSEASLVDSPFECRGDGLLVNGFPCETPAKLKQLLKPDENSGLKPIPTHQRPRKWWRAQCIHYGIHVPANVSRDTYRAHLGNAIPHQVELKRPREHILLEKRLNRAYHDAKTRRKGNTTPASIPKRRGSEIHDPAVEGNKRIRVAKHPVNPDTTGLDAPRFTYLDVLRQHELNMFIGMYNLKLDQTSPTARSEPAPTLVIAAGFDQLRFEGFIKLPGIMSCALVFELGSFSKENERQCITIRFRWRGKVTNGQILVLDQSQVGHLTLDIERRRVKGSIDGPVRAEFKGDRVSSAQRELSRRWEDLDVASN